jgi:NTP pyrophosphatase (non-canonical NTP hydrolase)
MSCVARVQGRMAGLGQDCGRWYTFPSQLSADCNVSFNSLSELSAAVLEFGRARDWHRYHTPKNLAAALIVEAAELLEPFQWLTPEESLALPEHKREAVKQEMADVLIYLISLANLLQVDLLQAAEEKLALNARKYPVDKARGSCAKYDEL